MTFKAVRTHIPTMMVVSLLLNLGMWIERLMIVTPTFAHGYYPWTWTAIGAELGPGRHHHRQLRLVRDAVHAVLRDFPVRSMYEVKEMVYHRIRARKKAANAPAPVAEPAQS